MTDVSPETMALLACPFCGWPARVERAGREEYISCSHLGCAAEDLCAPTAEAWNRRAGYSAALAAPLTEEVKALRDAAQFLIDVRDGRSTAEYLGDKTEAAIRMIRAALVQLRTANGEKK
jgi:hypothetical protein